MHYAAFSADARKNELRKIRFHDLRHSCASLLHANGVSMKEIQVWLGHSDISTTMNIYTHLDVDSKVASANAIIGIFPGEKKCPSNKTLVEEVRFDENAGKRGKEKLHKIKKRTRKHR